MRWDGVQLVKVRLTRKLAERIDLPPEEVWLLPGSQLEP